MLAGLCMQCLICAALIRPLYAKKVKNKPTMAAVEEIIPKQDEMQMSPGETVKYFSSHDGVFIRRRLSHLPGLTKQTFSSHMHISVITNPDHDKALRHHRGDMKLDPYVREDIFFSGSTYDIAQIQGKSSKCTEEHFASQITIESISQLTGCTKIKANLKKNFNYRIFQKPTFCLVVIAMTLHHMAFFVPYTYVISLTKEKGIDPETSAYLIICFGKKHCLIGV